VTFKKNELPTTLHWLYGWQKKMPLSGGNTIGHWFGRKEYYSAFELT